MLISSHINTGLRTKGYSYLRMKHEQHIFVVVEYHPNKVFPGHLVNSIGWYNKATIRYGNVKLRASKVRGFRTEGGMADSWTRCSFYVDIPKYLHIHRICMLNFSIIGRFLPAVSHPSASVAPKPPEPQPAQPACYSVLRYCAC